MSLPTTVTNHMHANKQKTLGTVQFNRTATPTGTISPPKFLFVTGWRKPCWKMVYPVEVLSWLLVPNGPLKKRDSDLVGREGRWGLIVPVPGTTLSVCSNRYMYIFTYLQIRVQIFPFVPGSLVEESDRRTLFVVEAGYAETARETATRVHHQRHLRLPQPCSVKREWESF